MWLWWSSGEVVLLGTSFPKEKNLVARHTEIDDTIAATPFQRNTALELSQDDPKFGVIWTSFKRGKALL